MSEQVTTAARIIRDLRIERKWTTTERDGAGFVAGELGVWLTSEPNANGSERLHIEVRLGRHVEDNSQTRQFLEKRNHNGLLGRWVLDPSTGVVALVADLLVTNATCPFATEAVAEVVNTAETLAYMSVPQRDLGGVTALTVLEGGRRPKHHKLVQHLPKYVYPVGTSDRVPAHLFPKIQDEVSTWLPDWAFQHGDDHSWAQTEDWTLLIRPIAHPHAGWGLQVVLTNRHGCDEDEALPHIAVLNRGDSHVLSEVAAPGAWTYVYVGLEYRAFLPAYLLKAGGDEDALQFVSSIVQGVAARASSTLFEQLDANFDSVLIRPRWPRDDEAVVLARRHPINDGEDAPDRFVWLDYGERAAFTTEKSFRLWRSQLEPEDLTDAGVVGFSEWFERELASRHGRRVSQENRGTDETSNG